MKTVMHTTEAVKAMIATGKTLVLAGDERALRGLPRGSWIAGTIPYFMGPRGGELNQDLVYVTELPDYVVKAEVKVYDEADVHRVYREAPHHGFSVMIIPSFCKTHLAFALNAPEFEDFAVSPLVGWISGFALDGPATAPLVYDGTRGKTLKNGAVVLQVELPAHKAAEVGIVNIFEPGEGDTIMFPRDGFSASTIQVNGEARNFADYLAEQAMDTKLPLVADLHGAMINTSFKHIDEAEKQVDFYAPVFADRPYKIAKPVGDYVASFLTRIPAGLGDDLFFSCNCVLNYLYAELAGKQTAGFTGPMTFGEIAYQLVNQTLVYLTIVDLA